MGKSYRIDLQIQTHTSAEMDTVIAELKAALKPLVQNGTIWTVSGNSREVVTPDAFTVE